MMKEGAVRTAQVFLNEVQKNTESIVSLLSSQCTRHSALVEIEQAVSTASRLVSGTESAVSPLLENAPYVRVFLPRNNILYSIALYCVVPAALGYRVQVRAPANLRSLLKELWLLIGLEQQEQTSLFLGSQQDFTDQFCASDVVIFTGRSENGHKIDRATEHKVFLGFGSSSNPFVVNEGAVLDDAVTALLETRLYNSGADCLAPDVIYIHESLIDDFNKSLIDKLGSLNVAALDEQNSLGLAPCPDEYTAEGVREIISSRQEDIIYEGCEVDLPNYVPPVILRSEIREDPIEECFGPVFNIVCFHEADELLSILESEVHRGTEMYLSWFGQNEEIAPDTFTLCSQSGPFEHEDPFVAFGGNGIDATWLSTSEGTQGQPLDVYSILRSELA